VLLQALMLAGVALLPLPALATGVRGLRRSGRPRAADLPGDRLSRGLLVALRALLLLLVLALTALVLLSLVAALVRGVTAMPTLLYEFFFADLALAVLVLLTSIRRGRRPGRRRATPAAR
jgi:hypothetical protein